MRPTPIEFDDAWPRIVRALASFTGSLAEAEEYAAEAVARAVAHEGRIDSYAAWCISVAKRAWIDETRRRAVERRLAPELLPPDAVPTEAVSRAMTATDPPDDAPDSGLVDGLDDRVALLFVACDDALSPSSQMVLSLRVVCGLTVPEIAHHLGLAPTAVAARLTRAKKSLAEARGEFRVPNRATRSERLSVVIACVAGMFTVAHRTAPHPADALEDTGAQSLSIADSLVTTFPDDPEVRGLRAVIRLGLARRPARLDDTGTALALDEVDRSRWDHRLLTAGLADATFATRGTGRFAIEAAISGLHSSSGRFEDTDWLQVVMLYGALEERWPAPSVRVARLAATAHGILAGALPTSGPAAASLEQVEDGLTALETGPADYARVDASMTLADIAWRTGRHGEAARRYRDLVDVVPTEALRRFCQRRLAG
ncbi:MAG: DUF6596 domain-containing protein [Terracoccus sp.]